MGWEQLFPTGFNLFQATPEPIAEAVPTGGRGAVSRLPLGDGKYAIVRHYRRGGFIRHFAYEVYWDRPFRPLAELTRTEIARQRGVPTVEILAAGIERAAFGLYRGLLISREAEGCLNCWEWLRGKPSRSERQSVTAVVARAIAQLHAAGIYHADLNLTNLLVQTGAAQPRVFIIDFDRARVFPDALSRRGRERNLRRLRRSLHKLDPARQFHSLADVDFFCQAYKRVGAFN